MAEIVDSHVKMEVQQENPSFWRALDGRVPQFDNPSMKITILPMNPRADVDIQSTLFRIQTGQISERDIEVARILGKHQVLTENQLRRLCAHLFEKSHELATRLRFLQKISWFDGFYIENEGYEREYVWTIGMASKNYLGFVVGAKDLPNPMHVLKHPDLYVSLCGVNEFIVQMKVKGIIDERQVRYQPPIMPKKEKPLAMVYFESSVGLVTFYFERLMQGKSPLQHMKSRLRKYVDWHNEKGELSSPIEGSRAVVIWSLGSLEGLDQLMESLEYLSTDFPQLFMIDELQSDVTQSFRFVEREDGVTIYPFTLEF